jgi:catechol 2,3-dioxygenase-like lactoylglutathione lyase family enzyme
MNTVNALKAHLAINVKDLKKSIEFYGKLFGIEPSKVRTGYAKFNVSNPPLNFSLNELPLNERDLFCRFCGAGFSQRMFKGALSHLGIQVSSTEDVLAVRERWIQEGLTPRDEMGTECCYARQDKASVHDPDGNEWEVFVVLEDNLPEKATVAQSCCGPTCCTPAKVTKG